VAFDGLRPMEEVTTTVTTALLAFSPTSFLQTMTIFGPLHLPMHRVARLPEPRLPAHLLDLLANNREC